MPDVTVKSEMKLGEIARILDILVASKALQPEQVDGILNKQKKLRAENIFKRVGEIAIEKDPTTQVGLITQVQLDESLTQQALARSTAAQEDRAAIAEKGSKDATVVTTVDGKSLKKSLEVNMEASGVVPSETTSPVAAGAIAAANIGHDIVVLTNRSKDAKAVAASDAIKDAVDATTALTQGIAGKKPLTLEDAEKWMEQAKAGLKEAAKQGAFTMPPGKDKQPLTDEKGQPLTPEKFIDAYIDARFSEIKAGVDKRLELQEQAKGAAKGVSALVAADVVGADAQGGRKTGAGAVIAV